MIRKLREDLTEVAFLGRRLVSSRGFNPEEKDKLDNLQGEEMRTLFIDTTLKIHKEADNLYQRRKKHFSDIINVYLERLSHEKIWPETAQEIPNNFDEKEDLSYSANENNCNPWEMIPDHLWDRTAIELWWKGYNRNEIAQRVYVSPGRVTNRISELRQSYPELVPTDEERRRKLINSLITKYWACV